MITEVINWIIKNNSLIAILISIVSLVYSFFNGKKLRKQQRLINEFTLKEKKIKEETNKKAKIKINVEKQDEAKYYIRVKNVGVAPAENIFIDWQGIDNSQNSKIAIYDKGNLPYPLLNSEEDFLIMLWLFEGHENTLPIIKIHWEDNFSKDNECKFTLSF